MSLAVAFKGPEGIVLAADSRVTLTAKLPTGELLPAYFDSATKLLSVSNQLFVGMVTYGAGALGQTEPRTAHGYIPEFEAHLSSRGNDRLGVEEFASEVSAFYLARWQGTGMPVPAMPPIQPLMFLVAGFDDGASYGRVFEVNIPNAPTPSERSPNQFGVSWGGQSEFVERLLIGVDPRAAGLAKDAASLDDTQVQSVTQKWRENLGLPIPYQFLPLQDCVNLSTFLVNMTSTVQTWTVAIRGVGGEVDVATITRTEGFRPLQQKRVQVYG